MLPLCGSVADMRRVVGCNLMVRCCRTDAYAAISEALVLVVGMCCYWKCLRKPFPYDLIIYKNSCNYEQNVTRQ